MISNLVIIFLVFLVVSIFSFGFLVLFEKQRKNKILFRGMNLSLFLVTLPQESKKEKEMPLEDYLRTAEQFYSSLAGFKEKKKGLGKFFLPAPFFVFEIAVHRIGEEIYFYFAVRDILLRQWKSKF